MNKITKAIRSPYLILPYLFERYRNFLLSQRRKKVALVKRQGAVFYEYRGALYPEYLNKGNACSFIAEKAGQYCRGNGIDVGADEWPLPGAIPVRNEERQNAYRLDDFPNGSLDYVFSSHCLEHLDSWQAALELWIGKIKMGGILFLYLPHKSMKMWSPGGPWGGYGHRWIPTAEIVNKFLKNNGMEILEHNPGKDRYWSFHIVAKKCCEMR